MIIKYLLRKSMKLWNLYLNQALFAYRIHTHAITHTSSYYLVYEQHPRLLRNDNHFLNVDISPQDYHACIEAMQSARQEASWVIYKWALRMKIARNALVQSHKLAENEWMLIRHEDSQKFESKWFELYQIMEKMMLGIYRL